HNGGAGRSFFGPNRGVTMFGPPFASCCLAPGLRAVTFSGSGTSKSVGEQSRTWQMTSRSSRRIVVGLPVHSPDILPTLISSPASASIRRSSADFQMPRSAAWTRRFHFIVSLHPFESGLQALVRLPPRVLDVLVRDVDVLRRGRQPLVAEQFLQGLQVHAGQIQR